MKAYYLLNRTYSADSLYDSFEKENVSILSDVVPSEPVTELDEAEFDSTVINQGIHSCQVLSKCNNEKFPTKISFVTGQHLENLIKFWQECKVGMDRNSHLSVENKTWDNFLKFLATDDEYYC